MWEQHRYTSFRLNCEYKFSRYCYTVLQQKLSQLAFFLVVILFQFSNCHISFSYHIIFPLYSSKIGSDVTSRLPQVHYILKTKVACLIGKLLSVAIRERLKNKEHQTEKRPTGSTTKVLHENKTKEKREIVEKGTRKSLLKFNRVGNVKIKTVNVLSKTYLPRGYFFLARSTLCLFRFFFSLFRFPWNIWRLEWSIIKRDEWSK